MEFTPEQLAQLKALIAEMMGTKTGDEDPATETPVKPDEKPMDADPVDVPGETKVDETDYAEGDEVRAAEKIEQIVEQVEEAIEEIKEASEDLVKASDAKGRKAAQDRMTKATAKLGAAKAKHAQIAADAKLAKDGGLVRQIAALQKQVTELKAKPAQDSVAATISMVADRDALANQVTQHVGVFDHSRMTADGVAKYAVDKLGIKCAKGSEAIALDAWMQGRKPAHETIARDNAPKTGADSAHSLWGTK